MKRTESQLWSFLVSQQIKQRYLFLVNQECHIKGISFLSLTSILQSLQLIGFHASPDRPIKYLFEDDFTSDKIKVSV